MNGGASPTFGIQTYNSAVILGAATTLSATGANAVYIWPARSDMYGLTINASGVLTRSASAVGGTEGAGLRVYLWPGDHSCANKTSPTIGKQGTV